MVAATSALRANWTCGQSVYIGSRAVGQVERLATLRFTVASIDAEIVEPDILFESVALGSL